MDKNKRSGEYTDDDIKDLLGKFGAVYFPDDIKETVEDIIGNERKKDRLNDFFQVLKKYNEIFEKLRETKLTPNLTVLLYGPPGTGKTSLTRGFAKKYKIPICVVESDRLVSPLLGDTIKNIRRVVELAGDIAKSRGSFILFFDEIDAIGSERSNIHEVGEIKRAVISFLQVIDKVNYQGYPLAIIGATNHQHQLDSAIWRRFTFHLKFDFPDFHLRKKIIESFVDTLKNAKIGVDDSIIQRLNSEYEQIKKTVKQLEKRLGRSIDEFKDGNLLWENLENRGIERGLIKLTSGYSGSDIERGTRVALFKSLNTELLTFDIFYNSLELVGGTSIHVQRQEHLSSPVEDTQRESRKKSRSSGPPEI